MKKVIIIVVDANTDFSDTFIKALGDITIEAAQSKLPCELFTENLDKVSTIRFNKTNNKVFVESDTDIEIGIRVQFGTIHDVLLSVLEDKIHDKHLVKSALPYLLALQPKGQFAEAIKIIAANDNNPIVVKVAKDFGFDESILHTISLLIYK